MGVGGEGDKFDSQRNATVGRKDRRGKRDKVSRQYMFIRKIFAPRDVNAETLPRSLDSSSFRIDFCSCRRSNSRGQE